MLAPFIECPPESIQVLLVSHFPKVLEADTRALSLDKRITVIGCATFPEDALDLVRMQTPDVIITGEYFYPSTDTGDYLAREVRVTHGLPFQPGIAVLTTMYDQHIADNVSRFDGDGCFRRDEYPNAENLIWLVHALHQRAQVRTNGKLVELRGDMETQKRRWLRWALRTCIKDDGIFVDYLDDSHKRKVYFIELIALIIEGGGMARCDLEDKIVEVAMKFQTTPERVLRKLLSYIKAAASYARRHRSELRRGNPFLMERKDVSLMPVIEYYSNAFIGDADLMTGIASTSPHRWENRT